jgi:uncharacterized protein YqeY
MSASDDLLRRIQGDTAAAMKAGERARVAVLRMLASDLKKAAIDTGVDAVTGDAAIAVLRRAARMRQDAAEQFEKAGRPDLAEKEKAEIAVVEGYLPRAATDDDIRAAAHAVLAEKGLSGREAMGAAMKETLARLGGAADGRAVARIVGELLKGG